MDWDIYIRYQRQLKLQFHSRTIKLATGVYSSEVACQTQWRGMEDVDAYNNKQRRQARRQRRQQR